MSRTDRDEVVNELLGQFKREILQMLNETADEFDKLGLSDEQRKTYNDFTGTFGQKVLSMRATVK
jgi:hypothetical protein